MLVRKAIPGKAITHAAEIPLKNGTMPTESVAILRAVNRSVVTDMLYGRT
jgi:hypothetical protein